MYTVSKATTTVLAALLLGGCATLAPDYQRPPAPVPDSWPSKAADTPQAQQDARAAADLEWRAYFNDAALQRLIELALENNRDLRVAALNVEKVQAQYRIQRADLLPSVDASAGYSAQRALFTLSGNDSTRSSHEYAVDLGFSAWELDLFGRLRSLKDQALEQYLASEQATRSTRISLVAEVASAYLTWSADAERLRLAQETLASQSESYALTRRSFEVGVASELDARQAQTSVDAARVDVAAFTALVAQDRNALALLLGTPVPADLLPAAPDQLRDVMSELSVGLPGEVLLQRPDVQQAEHALLAANANIGAARAAFFPSITLTASAGTASDSLSGLFASGSGTWSFLPQVTLPIFNAGSNRAHLRVAEVERDMLVAQYEKRIQTAFREVADALALRSNIDNQLAAQRSLTDATAVTYQLSEVRYRGGIDSYLNVLDAQRALYSAQKNLIATQLSRSTNLVTLYKVLGSGWQEADSAPDAIAVAR
ncbi:MAG: AdeC/AdeK/OprM family multidrug efflux complex outer membrane factor [Pseudomonadales bacterium]|nr:AdeC/AdeK/OprM family multidrug efflux complex outer membrane factor [Pseudomonadales bacterium]